MFRVVLECGFHAVFNGSQLLQEHMFAEKIIDYYRIRELNPIIIWISVAQTAHHQLTSMIS